jgi:hypothetical protein
LLFLPFVGCILVSSNVSSIVTLPRFGPRVLIASGMLLGVAAMIYLTRLTVASSYPRGVLPAMLVMGLGFGMIFAPAINTAAAGRPRPCSRAAAGKARDSGRPVQLLAFDNPRNGPAQWR